MLGAVSIKDVAHEAGVSMGTVSNVLNSPQIVRDETRAKVLAAIDRLGFVRNGAARQLRAGRSQAIGFIMLDVSNPFFTGVAVEVQRLAAARGYTLMLATSAGDPEVEAAQIELFREQRVQGILISPTGSSEPAFPGENMVLLDRLSSNPSVASISVDDVLGGQLAVEHLIARGRRRIAVVGGADELRQVRDRVNGAAYAASLAGAAIIRIPTPDLGVLAGREVGNRLAQLAPGSRPDAVFALNDLVAIGVLQAFALQRSMRVPEELAIIGYDDIDFTTSAVVPLSSIRQPIEAIAQGAVDLVLPTVDGDAQQVVLAPELVERASTGAVVRIL